MAALKPLAALSPSEMAQRYRADSSDHKAGSRGYHRPPPLAWPPCQAFHPLACAHPCANDLAGIGTGHRNGHGERHFMECAYG